MEAGASGQWVWKNAGSQLKRMKNVLLDTFSGLSDDLIQLQIIRWLETQKKELCWKPVPGGQASLRKRLFYRGSVGLGLDSQASAFVWSPQQSTGRWVCKCINSRRIRRPRWQWTGSPICSFLRSMNRWSRREGDRLGRPRRWRNRESCVRRLALSRRSAT